MREIVGTKTGVGYVESFQKENGLEGSFSDSDIDKQLENKLNG